MYSNLMMAQIPAATMIKLLSATSTDSAATATKAGALKRRLTQPKARALAQQEEWWHVREPHRLHRRCWRTRARNSTSRWRRT